jgi:hypothetical protein
LRAELKRKTVEADRSPARRIAHAGSFDNTEQAILQLLTSIQVAKVAGFFSFVENKQLLRLTVYVPLRALQRVAHLFTGIALKPWRLGRRLSEYVHKADSRESNPLVDCMASQTAVLRIL